MSDYKKILCEASLGRFYQQFAGGDENESKAIAILTASRAGNSSAINNARNANLRRVLRQFIEPTLNTEHKVGYYKVVGTYAETQDDGTSKRVKEDSTVVVIPPIPMLVEKFKKICMVLGAKFEQDSIFFAEKGQAKLIYTRDVKGTDGNVEHHKGEIVPLGAFHPQALGLAFTKIKGKSFAFDFISEAVDLGRDLSSEPMSMDQWFQTVSNQPITLYITPCRPECAYAENHLKAEAFLKDLYTAQYGSQVDGKGQFSFEKIGYIQHPVNGEELYRELHIDTFVVCGLKEHADYIKKMAYYLGKTHGCRYAILHMEDDDNLTVWNFEDYTTAWDELNGKANTVTIIPAWEYGEQMIFLNGFAPYREDKHFEIEASSVVTNPSSFNDAIPMNTMAEKIKKTVVPSVFDN